MSIITLAIYILLFGRIIYDYFQIRKLKNKNRVINNALIDILSLTADEKYKKVRKKLMKIIE